MRPLNLLTLDNPVLEAYFISSVKVDITVGLSPEGNIIPIEILPFIAASLLGVLY
jgi:hypothetical protein